MNDRPRGLPSGERSLLFSLRKQSHDATVADLKRGLRLLDIARALGAAPHAEPPPTQYRWRAGADARGPVFAFDNQQGAHLELDMAGDEIIGLAYGLDSARGPTHNGGRSYFLALTQDVPEALRERLSTLAAAFCPAGAETPWVTAALWSESGQICTPDTWDAFLHHGGWILEPLLMDPPAALRGYQRVFGLKDAQTQFAMALHARREALAPGEWLLLSRADYEQIVATGHAGLKHCNDILREQKIHQPYSPS